MSLPLCSVSWSVVAMSSNRKSCAFFSVRSRSAMSPSAMALLHCWIFF